MDPYGWVWQTESGSVATGGVECFIRGGVGWIHEERGIDLSVVDGKHKISLDSSALLQLLMPSDRYIALIRFTAYPTCEIRWSILH